MAKGATTKISIFGAICARLSVVSPDLFDIHAAANLCAERKHQGAPMDDADLLIAAQCIAREMTLVTHNTKHFNSIQFPICLLPIGSIKGESMQHITKAIRSFLQGADLLLLTLGLLLGGFGLLVLSSTSRPLDLPVSKYLLTQGMGTSIGLILFVVLTIVPLDFFGRFWKFFLGFSLVFLGSLIPFGADHHGNQSWIRIPGIPMSIQPAEFVKILFIVLLASHFYHFRDQQSKFVPMLSYIGHLGLMLGAVIVPSRDVGVALIYFAIFAAIFVASGVKLRWFAMGGILMIPAIPLLWTLLSDNRKNRILIILNPSADADHGGYQTILSMRMIAGGRAGGQGLFHGQNVQAGSMFSGHSDFVFASIGEELGLWGCGLVLLLMTFIILRCLYMATRAKNLCGSLVCVGVAGMFIFQTFLNVSMCLGIAPVIGITLPFISYGGSSIIASYAALGLVSSVKMHPKRGYRSGDG